MEVAPNNSTIAPVVLEATPEGRVVVDSLIAAQTWLERLELDLKDIDWQLGQPRRGHPTAGRDMTEEELAEWRNRASRARIYKEREIVELRRYIRESGESETRRLLVEGLQVVSSHGEQPRAIEAWMDEAERHLSETAA